MDLLHGTIKTRFGVAARECLIAASFRPSLTLTLRTMFRPVKILSAVSLVAVASQAGDADVTRFTNRVNLLRAESRFQAVAPMLLPRTNNVTTAGDPVVSARLPLNMDRYTAVELTGAVSRPATNVTVTATNEFRSVLRPGSTLLFEEKSVPAPIRADVATDTRELFSSILIKQTLPRPGAPSRTVSGTLRLLADVPAPWVPESNAYVSRLSVMLTAAEGESLDDLLPMTVQFVGTNVTRIEPRRVELSRADAGIGPDVWVVCNEYNENVAVTAHYQTAQTTRPLTLQKLSAWRLTQMILPPPMLFAAVVGGLMGGLLRLFKSDGWNGRRTARFLGEGVVVGIVTVAMLLAGLLHQQLAGLATSPKVVLAFSLAAAAGSVGAHFLDQTIRRLRGGSDEKEVASTPSVPPG